MKRRTRPGHRPFRPRRWALLLLLVGVLAVASDLLLPAGPFPPRERRVILVRRGMSVREISDELRRVGLLRGTLGFQALARVMHVDRGIKAGQYSFRLGITVPALLRALARGMSGLNLVTIPEGLTVTEVSLLLSNHLGVSIAEFDSLAHSRALLDSLGLEAPSLEGYLGPDSYEFLPGTPPEVAFRTMVRRQREVLARATAGIDSLPLGMSLHQILTLASIVESEAQVDAERPRIAAVYLNRLQRGMLLQADPTVAYSLGMRPRSRLFLRQLRHASPFNTYMSPGLPPGPICNPGQASIDAAVHPMPDMHDLYFVARGDGRHFFAPTYQQHLANIQTARALQAARAAGSATPGEAPAVMDSAASPIALAPPLPSPQPATPAPGSAAPAPGPATPATKAPASSTRSATKTTTPATKAPATSTKSATQPATPATKAPASSARSATKPATPATKAPATTRSATRPATPAAKAPAKSTKSATKPTATSTKAQASATKPATGTEVRAATPATTAKKPATATSRPDSSAHRKRRSGSKSPSSRPAEKP